MARKFQLIVEQLRPPALVIHGGAGAYLKTTTVEQRLARGRRLAGAVQAAHERFASGGARSAVLAAICDLELDPSFNAGRGSRLQRDGVCRLSAALMDGRRTRLSAVYNVEDCAHPSLIADALQGRPDRNLDGTGGRLLMRELVMATEDVRTPESVERWHALRATGDRADREAAIGSAGEQELELARRHRIPVPAELEGSEPDSRHGTIGAVALDTDGELWACTSTGGRGHEYPGRVSDTPTPAGNYACPVVALSATGFGEQIIDWNVCGRVATRMLDGAELEGALARTFEEVVAYGGLLGVIAVAADGTAGYAHSTEACGVAWLDGAGSLHIDRHGRSR